MFLFQKFNFLFWCFIFLWEVLRKLYARKQDLFMRVISFDTTNGQIIRKKPSNKLSIGFALIVLLDIDTRHITFWLEQKNFTEWMTQWKNWMNCCRCPLQVYLTRSCCYTALAKFISFPTLFFFLLYVSHSLTQVKKKIAKILWRSSYMMI